MCALAWRRSVSTSVRKGPEWSVRISLVDMALTRATQSLPRLGRRVSPRGAIGMSRCELRTGEGPIRQRVEPSLEEAFPVVLVVQVVGVLPKIANKEWSDSRLSERVAGVVRGAHGEKPGLIGHQPNPTR